MAVVAIRELRVSIGRVAQHDRDLARQMRRCCHSVPLNIAEGSAARDGRRRSRYTDALGSCRELVAALHVAEAMGYLPALDPVVLDRLDHINATLYRVIRG